MLELLRGEQRLERMLGELGRALGDEHPDVRALDVFAVARDTLARVRNQVADGNRKVFAELAPLFASSSSASTRAARVDPAAFERFMSACDRVRATDGGQELLRQAFPAYVSASQEPDEQRRGAVDAAGQLPDRPARADAPAAQHPAAIDAPLDVVAYEGLLARALDLLPRELRRTSSACSGPPTS